MSGAETVSWMCRPDGQRFRQQQFGDDTEEARLSGMPISITIDADDIYEAMYGVDFDDNVHIQDFGKDFHDVWGTDNYGNTWRLNVVLR